MSQVAVYVDDEKIMDSVMLVEPVAEGVRLVKMFEAPCIVPAPIRRVDLYHLNTPGRFSIFYHEGPKTQRLQPYSFVPWCLCGEISVAPYGLPRFFEKTRSI